MVRHELQAPLAVPMPTKKQPNKKFALNMNIYRNAYHHQLNQAKKIYKEIMAPQIEALPEFEKLDMVEFQLFPATARKCDVGNICCVHDKFFMDAVVEFGKLPDDNYEYVPSIHYNYQEIDRVNPRVNIVLIGRTKETTENEN